MKENPIKYIKNTTRLTVSGKRHQDNIFIDAEIEIEYEIGNYGQTHNNS